MKTCSIFTRYLRTHTYSGNSSTYMKFYMYTIYAHTPFEMCVQIVTVLFVKRFLLNFFYCCCYCFCSFAASRSVKQTRKNVARAGDEYMRTKTVYKQFCDPWPTIFSTVLHSFQCSMYFCCVEETCFNMFRANRILLWFLISNWILSHFQLNHLYCRLTSAMSLSVVYSIANLIKDNNKIVFDNQVVEYWWRNMLKHVCRRFQVDFSGLIS